jgi:hypothetical protein
MFNALVRRAELGTLLLDASEQLRAAIESDREILSAHLGGQPSATEARMIESVLVLDILIGSALDAIQKYGAVDLRKKQLRPVTQQLSHLLEQRRRLLLNLGFRPRTKEIDPIRALHERLERESRNSSSEEKP